MTINERIREVRKRLKYTQTEFGKRISVAQGYLASIENGDKPVTEKIFKLVCSEFGVNETWLREGKGEMFVSESDLIVLLGSTMDKLDDMDIRILTEYVKLSPEVRKIIKEFIRRVANEVT